MSPGTSPGRRRLYLLGGPSRVGKSALARELSRRAGVPWLSTDIVRSGLRVGLPELDRLDRGLVSEAVIAEVARHLGIDVPPAP